MREILDLAAHLDQALADFHQADPQFRERLGVEYLLQQAGLHFQGGLNPLRSGQAIVGLSHTR